MKITIPKGPSACWSEGYRRALLRLPDCEVGDIEQPPRRLVGRDTMLVGVDDKRVLISCDDKDNGVRNAVRDDLADLILQVQYTGGMADRDFGDRVQPFVMFATAMGEFHERVDEWRAIVQAARSASEKRFRVGWSGRAWGPKQGRLPYLEALEGQEWADIERTTGQATSRGLDWPDYCRRMGTWDWALILSGPGSSPAMANRREHECAALGIPMLLNYEPVYYVRLEANEHYVKVETPEQIEEPLCGAGGGLSLYSGEHLVQKHVAKAAREYWEHNQSPAGIGRLFKQICKEHL